MFKSTQILVVDSDPVSLQGTTRLLNAAGYEVLGATSGNSCLTVVRAKRPDLILLETRLPDIPGTEVCKQIKSDRTLAGSVVYLLSSAETSSDFQVEGIDSGADGFIARPVQNRELVARVQAILRIRHIERTLRESQALLRLSLESSRTGTWEWNLLNNNVRWDDYIYPIFGQAPGTFAGTFEAMLQCIHPEDWLPARQVFDRAIQDGRKYNVTFRILWPDGTTHRIACSGQAFYTETGRPSRLIGVCTDITERQRTDDALQATAGRFELAVRASNEGLWDWNILTNDVTYSHRFKELIGAEDSEDQQIFASLDFLIHPDDYERVLAAVNDHLERRVPHDIEYRIKVRNGAYRWFRARAQAVWDEFGKAVRMGGSISDITERKKAEERIREQAALLDKAQDAIVLLDLSHQVVYWNKSAERLYGWNKAEIQGNKADEFWFKKENAPTEDAHRQLMETGEWRGELTQLAKDGREVVVESRWTLIRNEEGHPKSKLLINTDVTERKKLEGQFLRTQRMESIGTLAGGIAHDLNNALAPIGMVAQLLREKLADEQSHRLLDTLETSARRGVEMVKQILSFSRGAEGERQVLQIKHLVSEMVKFINETFPRSIRIQTTLAKDLWSIKGDPTNLYQVLMNLCVNARDAMASSGGLLQITAENAEIDEEEAAAQGDAKPGDYLALTVSDTGGGIEPEIVEKVFEPFFTTKEIGKGTGLGLSTSLGIVKSHGGFMTVDSVAGEGSRFQVFLPACRAAAAPPQERESSEMPQGKGELVLLVDDEVSVRKITKVTLENFGYRVITASDGTEALAIFLQQKDDVDLVLTDVMMPYMDGPATIRALQKIDPEVKVLAATGLTSNGRVTELEGLGVAHVLAKPFTAEKLLWTLHDLLATP